MVRNRYQNRWGRLQQIHVPTSVFQDGSLILNTDSLAVFLVLLHIHRNKPRKEYEPLATVKVGQEKLTQRTGYSKNAITNAVKELKQRRFIELIAHRKKRQEFGTNEYIFCHPDSGEPLPAQRSLLYGNGLPYFTMPSCIIKEHQANWSLREMTGSEIKLYIGILYAANRQRANEFMITAAELRKLCDLAQPTFKKALDGLENRGLIWFVSAENKLQLNLCDPYTAEPLHETGIDEDDPANYFVTAQDGRTKRLNLNLGDADQIEQLIRSCVPDEPVMQGNGDLMIRCPFHADSNPSCSVSPKKNGCFYCFGCLKSGSLSALIMQLKDVTKGEAIQHIATATGVTVEYHEPDKNAIAKYSYRNEKDKLVKQVLRYPDIDGRKVFMQRRPAKGDWIWNVGGLPPILFNMELLEYAGVACITEGEKDACTVTDLHLLGDTGMVIGMTSGGAESWDAQLAKHLRGKRSWSCPTPTQRVRDSQRT